MATREEIIIIDDEDNVRDILSQCVELEGYVPRTFSDARDALKRIEEVKPILVLADISMPEMNGLDFVRELRKSHVHLPVIFLTAFADHDNFRESLRYRVADFIAKPYTADVVRKAIQKALGSDESFTKAFMETVTHRLREARLSLGLKQSDVAARCGMSTSQVSQIELQQSAPSVIALLRLCKSLHLTMSELVEGF